MKTNLARPTALRAAFTLIEIMIVVLIIGMLAMVAVPNVKRALETSRYNTIVANLRTIDMVKTQWAAENKKGDADVPTEQDLAPYFSGQRFPVSVVGETYNINNVGQAPTATIPVKLRDIQAGGTMGMPEK
jgi:prepilin-type N-terminal cleavage/methylation domain-containing protein